MTPRDDDLSRFEIGRKVRELREEAALSRVELATRTGATEDALALWEEGRETPSLAELVRLAGQLGTEPAYFLRAPPSGVRLEIVRADERRRHGPPTAAAKTLDFRYEALTYGLTGRTMMPFLVEIPPRRSADVELSSHPGEEFILVLDGEIEASIGEKTVRLARGDAIYFDSNERHVLRARGARAARLLTCLVGARRASEANPLERAFREPDERNEGGVKP